MEANAESSQFSRKRLFAFCAYLVGFVLLAVNVYGLTQSLRPDDLHPPYLRFGGNDLKLNEDQFREQVSRRPDESDLGYANRLTTVIADGLAHVHWPKYPIDQFNQRVPIWENYILWSMSYITPIPEFKRYHFTTPDKSIERGIGICGDASILMSRMLDKSRIENRIITIPGHVLVEAKINGEWSAFDPDYGVVIGRSASMASLEPAVVKTLYLSSGHTRYDADFVASRLQENIRYWGGVDGFIGKKYYFENFAYIAKWFLPLALLSLPSVIRRIHKRDGD